MKLQSSFVLSALIVLAQPIASCQITTAELPSAHPGIPYTVQLGIKVSGIPPFRFQISDGKLPAGLVLSADGLITGTPRTIAEGPSLFTVTVTDLQGHSVAASFHLISTTKVDLVMALEDASAKKLDEARPDGPALPVEPTLSKPGRPSAAPISDAVKQPDQKLPPTPQTSTQKPSINTDLGKGVSLVEGMASPSILEEKHVDKYVQETRVSVLSCMPPAGMIISTDSHACPNAYTHVVTVTNGPKGQGHYVVTDSDGFYTASMTSPIACTTYPVDTRGMDKKAAKAERQKVQYSYLAIDALDVASGKVERSPWKQQCEKRRDFSGRCDREYNDCDEQFSVVGGVEQAGLSALPSQTSPFLRAFTRSTPSQQNLSVWANIRLLGAPEASSTANVISAAADPSGVLITKNFATVGTAIDYIVGGEFAWSQLHNYALGGQYSVSFIGGLGATTPLSSQSLVLAYQVPALNTIECSQLQLRFTAVNGYTPAPVPGSPSAPGSSTPNATCLFNNSGTASSTTNSGTPVKTLAFTNRDRSNFLLKYGLGIRTITRFHSGTSTLCGSTVPYEPQRGPCSRGVVDFTVGQDQAITGGYLRHFILKIDGVQPLPIAGSKILYIFGNASIRFSRNANFSPLILQSASLDPLTKSGPDPSIFVLPLKQPDRDFYRYGVGLDLSAIFSKLSPKGDDKPVVMSPKKADTTAPATQQ